jgi:hypothetical protein
MDSLFSPLAVRRSRAAASLIELLVVLFIMGIMMGLLLPALNNARNQAQAKVCQNNVRQLDLALYQFVDAKRRHPDPSWWTVDILPWIEQRPLAELMKQNKDPNPKFPRPPIMRCPMQDDVLSRVVGVGYCHYVWVVDRLPSGKVDRVDGIQDLPLFASESPPDPWYIGPEITLATRDDLLANKPGPHPPNLYMTISGLRP